MPSANGSGYDAPTDNALTDLNAVRMVEIIVARLSLGCSGRVSNIDACALSYSRDVAPDGERGCHGNGA